MQLAVVLCYVTDLGVKEWLVKSEDATSGKWAADIVGLIICFLEGNEYPDNVVAQCFYGAGSCLSSGLALFKHFTSSEFGSDSRLKECKIFFTHLTGLAAFFF